MYKVLNNQINNSSLDNVDQKSVKIDSNMNDQLKSADFASKTIIHNERLKIIIAAVAAVIFGLAMGSLVYYLAIPKRNPKTVTPTAFLIESKGFNKVDLGFEKIPKLNEEKLLAAKKINDWLSSQKDLRGRGMYAPTAECTYNVNTPFGICKNPNLTDVDFFSNRSFQAPIWALYKNYQATGDKAVLAQVEDELLIVKEVVLDQPEKYFIQNNDYSCLYLKDLYFSDDLSAVGKQVVYDVCTKAEFELLDPAGLVSAEQTKLNIEVKLNAILNNTAYDTVHDSVWDSTIAKNNFVSRDFYLSIINDFRVLPELILASQLDQSHDMAESISPLMDVLLSEYVYMDLGNLHDSYYDSSMIISLMYYSKFVDKGANPQIMQLAQKIYNESFVSGKMSTVRDLNNYALVQYHLGFPMSQIQTSLLALFLEQGNELINGQHDFVIDSKSNLSAESATYIGNVGLNGLISGVLSI